MIQIQETRKMFLFLTLSYFVVVANSQGCDSPLGVSDGRITDDQITASTFIKSHEPYRARLNQNLGAGAWCAKTSDSTPWIRIELNGTYRVTAVAVQGRNHTKYQGWYINAFEILYSNNRRITRYGRFLGPNGKNDIAFAKLTNVVTSIIVIKAKHRSWYPVNGRACLRMELYGCDAKPTTPPPVDHCAKNNTCAHKCVNGVNKAICKCLQGFELANDRSSCNDINECRLGSDRCEVFTTKCVNTPGSYRCDCNHPGLEKRPFYRLKCFDINECDNGNGGCNHRCKNMNKYYKCLCYPNYTLANDNHTCIDDNECTNNVSTCNLNTTTCKNEPGTYSCPCLTGLKHLTNDNCEDINECDTQNGGCEETCTNTYQSYKCSCRKGALLNADQHKCDDINECTLNIHDCEQECRNNYGSYYCDCRTGYSLNTDKKTCFDINECLPRNGKGPCEHTCKNTDGSFKCFCPKGFHLSVDGMSCQDDDECATNLHGCDPGTSKCINTHGSFECRCIDGFKKDPIGNCVAKRCPAMNPVSNGFIIPNDCMGPNKQYLDVCSYKCIDGYELNAKSAKTAYCNSDGNWDMRGGFQALCERVRCGKMAPVVGGSIIPSSCATGGARYGDNCRLYCNNGYKSIGRNTATCQKDRSYDGDFSQSKCVAKVKLQCPSDIKIVLPLGANETSLPLSKLNIKLDVANIKSVPDGILTGKYKFKSMFHSQAVKLIPNGQLYSDESCTFHVTVQDHELPKILNCPTKDTYVSLSTSAGVVSWPEPRFKDNVGVVKVIQNIKNNQVLPQQVYYVFYAARDSYGNEAMCRFFVHVKARYCSKSTMTGGAGGTPIWFGGESTLSIFLTCPPGKTFSTNVTGASIFRCTQGIWQDVPDCVGYLPKNGPCPIGHLTVVNGMTNSMHCAKCPKGTIGSNTTAETCEECPMGSYQDEEGRLSCKKCPLGTTSLRGGLKEKKACQAQCQPGGYSSTGLYGSKGCERCPEGSFQNLHGQQSCKLCPNGGSTYVGAKTEDECLLPARVSKIFPATETISAVVGDTVIIKCYGTGSPSPYMTITNSTDLAPALFRGKSSLQPLVTGNKYISGLQLTIAGVTTDDTAIYKCKADNKKGSMGAIDERDIVIEVSVKL